MLTKKVTTNDMINTQTSIPETKRVSASTKEAAKTIGIAKRKENLIASSFFNPLNNPAEIVAPDLETPGNIAKAWNIPIVKESKADIFPFFSFTNFVEKTIAPLIRKNIPKAVMTNIHLAKF